MTFIPKIYHDGPDKLVVASGGEITVESSGALTLESGSVLDIESGGSITVPGEVTVESGGVLTVESGGSVAVESGGSIDLESGSAINVVSGSSIACVTGGEVDCADATLKVNSVALSGCVRAGIHTASAGEATAGTLGIVTGLATVVSHVVQVLDTGDRVVTSDADITEATGTITVADGAAFAVTENYLIHWIAVGT